MKQVAAASLILAGVGCGANRTEVLNCVFESSEPRALRLGDSYAVIMPEVVKADDAGNLVVAGSGSTLLKKQRDEGWVETGVSILGVIVNDRGEVRALPQPNWLPKEAIKGVRAASIGGQDWQFLMAEASDPSATHGNERIERFWSVVLHSDLTWGEPEPIDVPSAHYGWATASSLVASRNGSLLYLIGSLDEGLFAFRNAGTGWNITKHPGAAYAVAAWGPDGTLLVAQVGVDRTQAEDANSLFLHGPPPDMPMLHLITQGGISSGVYEPSMAWLRDRPMLVWLRQTPASGFHAEAVLDASIATSPVVPIDSAVQAVELVILDDRPIAVAQRRKVQQGEEATIAVYVFEKSAAVRIATLTDPFLTGFNAAPLSDREIAVVGVGSRISDEPGIVSVLKLTKVCDI